MCILFWYQYDGTTEKIKVSGPADTKSKPEEAAKPTTAGNNPENEEAAQEAQDEFQEPDFLDPNYAAGLEAASDYSESFDDPEHPVNKVLHKYKLIIAANRDEFMDREASPLHIWNDANDIVAGKDKKEGGTWMGVSRKFKCASVILNKYSKKREEETPKNSRGSIVVNNLKNHSEFASKLRAECTENKYLPFYLLSFDFEGPLKVAYYTCGADGKLKHKEITGTGFCSHSNSSMESPWVKTKTGQELFENTVTESLMKTSEKTKMQVMRDLKASLIKMLKTDTRHEDPALCASYNGLLPPDTAEDLSLLSSIFVKSKCDKFKYGTRVHTILIVDQKNDVYFIEQNSVTGKEEYLRFSCK